MAKGRKGRSLGVPVRRGAPSWTARARIHGKTSTACGSLNYPHHNAEYGRVICPPLNGAGPLSESHFEISAFRLQARATLYAAEMSGGADDAFNDCFVFFFFICWYVTGKINIVSVSYKYLKYKNENIIGFLFIFFYRGEKGNRDCCVKITVGN